MSAAILGVCLSLEQNTLRGHSIHKQGSRSLGKGGKGKGSKKGQGIKSSKLPKSSKVPKSSKSPGKGGKGSKSSKMPGSKGKGGKGSKSSKSPGGKGKGGKGSKSLKKSKKSYVNTDDDVFSSPNDDIPSRDDDDSVVPNPNAACDTPEGRKADILEIPQDISGDISKDSPQDKALSWLMSDAETNACDGVEPVVQRYALALLYYSTNGSSWDNASGWLSSFSVCTAWYGVVCEGGDVVAINLRKYMAFFSF